jgi:hypothetical protein
VILGCDSATPPSASDGVDVWGIYVAGAAAYIWTRAEAAALEVHGVLPIAVPPQSWPWPRGAATLVDLVAEARAWGIPHLSPLVLDIEEGQAEEMGSRNLAAVGAQWVSACETPVDCGMPTTLPWVYGSAHTLAQMPPAVRRWLALWPEPTPAAPAPPAGYAAWQYAGDVHGAVGLVDLDTFAPGYRFATPDMGSTVVVGPRPRLN